MRKKLGDKPEEDFLTRWSRKKGEEEHLPDLLIEEDETLATEDKSQQQVQNLTDEDMPPVESLDENSDYSGFLSPGVSDELRQLALRKLFRSAKFNVRDGLDDYDDDFRSFAALGDIITSDMKHQFELAEERKKAAEEQELMAAQQQSEETEQENVDQVAERDDVESDIDDTEQQDQDENKNGDKV